GSFGRACTPELRRQMLERLAHTAASRLLPLRGYAGSAGENWRLTGQGLCRVEGHDNRRGAAGSGRRSALLQLRALIAMPVRCRGGSHHQCSLRIAPGAPRWGANAAGIGRTIGASSRSPVRKIAQDVFEPEDAMTTSGTG